ncbi:MULTISPECIES: gluconate 2-dehydrogenase subunit 3 family protein [Paenibacillus]|uniref:gluconate 2-dehydrogenase subunit 3 family protein n=1 Tax=Paenibacillus TaxID=44249 RepID=UPI0022B86738|nr:gluconate 2-dehydrogenase subunit 3 family protein [Paenibacillus caseinilyticus]MCZ8521633.1 gluconate 2-dehydrogenase subunit 3 family protein [Paenibacillus caseinilyticus]
MEQQDGQKPKEEQGEPGKLSRRNFIKNTGFVLGGAVLGGAIGSLIKKSPQTAAPAPAPAAAEPKNYNRALMFFTPEQFAVTEAAVERIFPADENGPGAKELGVAFFIDHQLAGDYGFNARDYMSPPFFAGEKVQGYQGRLKRREMYEIGLRELENYSQAQFQTGFTGLTDEQKDQALKAFETDEAKLTTISASGFFKTLRSNTLEGAYSDPLYGGNIDMKGWQMRNFPGAQMSYATVIDKEFTKIPPQSLQEHMTH